MSCYSIDTMNPIKVIEKGASWLVYQDGSIWNEARTRTTTRIRNGVEQTFTSNFPSVKLSPFLNRNGYLVVSTLKDGKRPKVFTHRLIAMCFVHGYRPHLTVNHINGIKTDNRPENLEWVSLAKNSKHAWETGLVDLRGEKQPNHKLTQRQVIHIRKALRLGVPANSLSIIANVNPSTIHLIEKGKRWAGIGDVD
jgi:hypothetical protein